MGQLDTLISVPLHPSISVTAYFEIELLRIQPEGDLSSILHQSFLCFLGNTFLHSGIHEYNLKSFLYHVNILNHELANMSFLFISTFSE